MNKIEEYIENIYGNFDNSDKDTKILKEEMRNHLYEEAKELEKQGLSKEKSVSRVLEHFGEENAVVDEMNYILKNRSIFTKMLIKAGVAIFIIGCLFQIIGMFSDNGAFKYFSGELSENGFKNISYLLFMISLATWDIAFYYYYFIKKMELVLMSFIFCDFVICVPLVFVCMYFPHNKMQGLVFILGITFIITLILRVYYVKRKRWN
ncbi:permease prefix domain 1-containing protein [Clostridium sp. FAM 1755]|uniref:permease prefix domain 1-containing protein n=1 Tax=Clostridium caseinilyticum TaxID=3350403 RepID=UPI0038F7D2A4